MKWHYRWRWYTASAYLITIHIHEIDIDFAIGWLELAWFSDTYTNNNTTEKAQWTSTLMPLTYSIRFITINVMNLVEWYRWQINISFVKTGIKSINMWEFKQLTIKTTKMFLVKWTFHPISVAGAIFDCFEAQAAWHNWLRCTSYKWANKNVNTFKLCQLAINSLFPFSWLELFLKYNGI